MWQSLFCHTKEIDLGGRMLKDFVVVDLETTGLSAKDNRIIEIGAVKVREGLPEEIFETFVNPGCVIPKRITEVTGIDDDMVKEAPYIETEIGRFIEFSEELPLIGHNLLFDYSFLKVNAVNNNLTFDRRGIDTLKIARERLSDLPSKRLDFLCRHFGIADENHHRAVNDAKVTYELYKVFCKLYENENEVFEPAELMYKAKKQSPITDKQIRYLRDLVGYHHINIDYEIDKLTKNQASRIIDNIILEHGRIF